MNETAPSLQRDLQLSGNVDDITPCRSQPESAEAPPAADPSPSLNQEEVMKLLSIFESRLSFLLLQSVKLLSSTKKKTR